jgi:hypothetical protein
MNNAASNFLILFTELLAQERVRFPAMIITAAARD